MASGWDKFWKDAGKATTKTLKKIARDSVSGLEKFAVGSYKNLAAFGQDTGLFGAAEYVGNNYLFPGVEAARLNAEIADITADNAERDAKYGTQIADLQSQNADLIAENAANEREAADHAQQSARRSTRVAGQKLRLEHQSTDEANREAAIKTYQENSASEARTAGSGVSEGTPLDAMRQSMSENRRSLSEYMNRSMSAMALYDEQTAIGVQDAGFSGAMGIRQAGIGSRQADIGVDMAKIGEGRAALAVEGAKIQRLRADYASDQYAFMTSPLNQLVQAGTFAMSMYSGVKSLTSMGMSLSANGGIKGMFDGSSSLLMDGARADFKANTGYDFTGDFNLSTIWGGQGGGGSYQPGTFSLPEITPMFGKGFEPMNFDGYEDSYMRLSSLSGRAGFSNGVR